jgi:hypothetical protein
MDVSSGGAKLALVNPERTEDVQKGAPARLMSISGGDNCRFQDMQAVFRWGENGVTGVQWRKEIADPEASVAECGKPAWDLFSQLKSNGNAPTAQQAERMLLDVYKAIARADWRPGMEVPRRGDSQGVVE